MHQVGDEADVIRPVVQGGEVAVALAAGMEEDLAILLVDLLDRLQAVGREAGADHVELAQPGLRQGRDRLVGVGLQPLLLAEERLEGDLPLLAGELQLLGG